MLESHENHNNDYEQLITYGTTNDTKQPVDEYRSLRVYERPIDWIFHVNEFQEID